MPRLTFSLLLAFALLFAQQGAVLHALAHLADGSPAQSQQEKHLPHSPSCDKCVVYAGIGGAAASTPLGFADNAIVGIPAIAVLILVFSSPLQPYRSRAPPRSA